MLMCGLLELKQEEQQHKEEIVSTFKSPSAKYWLLLEDGYFYLMV